MRLVWVGVLSALCLAGCGQKTAEDHKKEVEQATQKFEAALIREKINEFSSLWASDGVYINLTTHQTVKGQEALRTYFADIFSRATFSKVEIDSVDINGDMATEVGRFVLSFNGKDLETHTIKMILVNDDGAWKIQKVIEAEFIKSATHYKELQDLQWFVGKWIDAEPDVDVYYDNRWDENRNFIIQDYKMKVLGEKELSGQQIIGWDPAAKEVHSWIFDSDGGFGEGHWSKEGGAWYVRVAFVLSDGRKASAVHVYKKIDSDTYTFTTQERDLDGSLLPDIGPIKIVRQK